MEQDDKRIADLVNKLMDSNNLEKAPLEIKSKTGIVKIPTNFRPLLPFTDKVINKNTFVKRIFINGNSWVKFEKRQRV